MSKSPPTPARKPIALDLIASHARSLEYIDAPELAQRHAEVCANRQIAIKDQELRAFLVKHSVIRIHCVVVFAMIFIVAGLFAPLGGTVAADTIAAVLVIVSLAIAASMRSIANAVAAERRPRDACQK